MLVDSNRSQLGDSLSQFCPDLVLVCAGFDSAIGDPEVYGV